MDSVAAGGDGILLIHNNATDARVIRAALADADDDFGEVQWVTHLADGVERLHRNGVGVILVNLFLPDSQGLATFDAVLLAAPHIPIVVLSTLGREAIAKQAVQRGACDYVLPDHLDSYSLPRALHHAIQRTVAADTLFLEKERAEVTLNSIGDAVLSTDLAGNITYLNPVAERMTGWPQHEAVGRPLAEVFHIIDGVTRRTARDPVQLAMENNATVGLTDNCVLVRRDGEESAIEDSTAPIRDRNARMTGAVIVFHDVGEARAMTQKMTHLAHHDVLTDLPNRILLKERLVQSIAVARRHGTYLAVLFVDVDRFKQINDSLGHAVGDQLLQCIGTRLATCVRSADTVSRQGGDEFVILLSKITHIDDAARGAERILATLQMPYQITEHTLDVGLAHMAVNISAVEFRSKNFLSNLREALQDTGCEARYLEIELTEGVLIRDSESTTLILNTLKAMGVRLAVDDFGTGYSSLSYLRCFPIDVIKIDRSFVRDISTDPDAATIVSAVIGMGRSLKQQVIAEGIETREQCAFLQHEGCDEGQGYYFGRPVPAEDFGRLLMAEVARPSHKGPMRTLLPNPGSAPAEYATA